MKGKNDVDWKKVVDEIKRALGLSIKRASPFASAETIAIFAESFSKAIDESVKKHTKKNSPRRRRRVSKRVRPA